LTQQDKQVLALTRADDVDPETGLWLAALHDTRQRMREVLTRLPDELVDQVPPSGGSTIGALLYHIAIVEADWLFDEILGTIDTDFPKDIFPVEMREDGNTLTWFSGETLAQHLARLKTIRAMLVETVSGMSRAQLHELHERSSYDVSTAWVLHHLMQHEAEHRSQIGAVREALGAPKPGW
jgi:uncharacterized damage-inducible protein DinB